MAEITMTKRSLIKSENMMKLERSQQEKEMIARLDGCLLDYQYFKNHYQLIAVDLSKQKELDADPRATQQIEFYGMLNINSQETVLEFYKGAAKAL